MLIRIRAIDTIKIFQTRSGRGYCWLLQRRINLATSLPRPDVTHVERGQADGCPGATPSAAPVLRGLFFGFRGVGKPVAHCRVSPRGAAARLPAVQAKWEPTGVAWPGFGIECHTVTEPLAGAHNESGTCVDSLGLDRAPVGSVWPLLALMECRTCLSSDPIVLRRVFTQARWKGSRATGFEEVAVGVFRPTDRHRVGRSTTPTRQTDTRICRPGRS